jgi:hypothetical protein
MCADDALLQTLRRELHQRGCLPLLMQPTTGRIDRPQPRVAANRLYAALTQGNDELLKVGFGDNGGRCGSIRQRGAERLPGALIPLAGGGSDVVDVDALAEKRSKWACSRCMGARRSFLTSLFPRSCCNC